MAHVIFAAVLVALMAFIAASTVRSGLLLRRWAPPFNLLLSWPDNLLRLGVIAACVVLGLALGPGPAALGWTTGTLRGNLLIGLMAGLALSVLLTAAGLVVGRIWRIEANANRVLQAILPANGREWPGVALALFPAAALEELLFRSLPLAGLAWLISPWWLLWPLALIFGLLHWPQGGWGVAGTTLAAVAFSLLFLLSGSIWPPLIAHYLMNLAQVALGKAAGVQPLRSESSS